MVAVIVALNKLPDKKGKKEAGFSNEDVELLQQLAVHAQARGRVCMFVRPRGGRVAAHSSPLDAQIALRNASLFEQNKAALKQAHRSGQVRGPTWRFRYGYVLMLSSRPSHAELEAMTAAP